MRPSFFGSSCSIADVMLVLRVNGADLGALISRWGQDSAASITDLYRLIRPMACTSDTCSPAPVHTVKVPKGRQVINETAWAAEFVRSAFSMMPEARAQRESAALR